MNLSRRSFLAAAAALPVAAAGRAWGAEVRPFTVTAYGGGYQHFNDDQLAAPFFYTTHVPIQINVGRPSAWVAALRNSRRDNPPFDVMIASQNWTTQAIDDGLVQPLRTDLLPNLGDALPLARVSGDMAVTCAVAPIGLAWRPDRVPEPTSWRDLWENPAYAGRIGLYPPENSFGMMFLMMTARLFHGSDRALDAAVETVAKLKPFTTLPSSGDASEALISGRVAVAPLDFPAVGALGDLGHKVRVAIPREGVFMYAHMLSIPAGSPHTESAHAWINHLLGIDSQKAFLSRMFWSPVNRRVTVPDSYADVVPIAGARMDEIVTFDWEEANSQRDRIVARWREAFAG